MTQQNDAIQEDIRQRLLETIVVLEEYTPKLQHIDDSIISFKIIIDNQKNLINQFFESINNESVKFNDNANNLINHASVINKKSKLLFLSSIVILSFICGSLLSFHYSEKYYFSDHRHQRINNIEAESLRVLNTYYSDLNMIDKLKSMGCVINNDMLLAPVGKVKNVGLSEDKKFQGVWLK